MHEGVRQGAWSPTSSAGGRRWHLKAAEAGNSEAMFFVANSYQFEHGCERNFKVDAASAMEGGPQSALTTSVPRVPSRGPARRRAT